MRIAILTGLLFTTSVSFSQTSLDSIAISYDTLVMTIDEKDTNCFVFHADTVLSDPGKLQSCLKFYRKSVTDYIWKNKWSLTGFVVAGMLDGTVEILRHDYDNFEMVFPNANPYYCNPGQSWYNKYKNHDPAQGPAFPGSTGPLVWTTDLYHLLRTAEKTALSISITIKIGGKKQKWYSYLIDAAAHQCAYSLGDWITYQGIFKHSTR